MRFSAFTSLVLVAAFSVSVSSAPLPSQDDEAVFIREISSEKRGYYTFPSYAKGGNAQSGNSGNADGGSVGNFGWKIINYPYASMSTSTRSRLVDSNAEPFGF